MYDSSVSYPAGQVYTTSPGHPMGVVVPPSGMPSAPTSDIEFVGKATNYLNHATSNEMNVFTFHNNMQDALASGQFSKYSDIVSFNGLLQSSPDDWKQKYAASPDGLDMMFNDLSGLVNLSHAMWNDKPSPLGPATTWSMQGVDSFDTYIKTSQDQNQGTEKEGMADHPDYNNVNHEEPVGSDLMMAYGSYKGGSQALQKGSGLLTDSAEAATYGEEALLADGLAVGEGVAVGTAEAIGVASGVGLVAAGAVGLAIAGYEVYKAFGGTGKLPLLDKIGHSFSSFF